MRQLTRLDMFGFKVESKALEVQSVVTFGPFDTWDQSLASWGV